MPKLTGNEIAFDFDVSKLPCGMNGASYLSEMNELGGSSKLNPGGAAYDCDAQCFTTPFINGVVSYFLHQIHQIISSEEPGQYRRSWILPQRDGHMGSQQNGDIDRTTYVQSNWLL
jgi:hypothetical protein